MRQISWEQTGEGERLGRLLATLAFKWRNAVDDNAPDDSESAGDSRCTFSAARSSQRHAYFDDLATARKAASESRSATGRPRTPSVEFQSAKAPRVTSGKPLSRAQRRKLHRQNRRQEASDARAVERAEPSRPSASGVGFKADGVTVEITERLAVDGTNRKRAGTSRAASIEANWSVDSDAVRKGSGRN